MASTAGSTGTAKTVGLVDVLASSRQRAGWPGFLVEEHSDSGGAANGESPYGFRVFAMVGGEVETWWTQNGVARWRRASVGALSVGTPGSGARSSWVGRRQYVFASFPKAFVQLLIEDSDELRRMEAMTAHVCLHEYHRDAATGLGLLMGMREMLHNDAPEAALRVEALGTELVSWLSELSGAPPRSEPPDGLNRVQLGRVVERIDTGIDGPLTLRDLASAAGVSAFHFCRMFRKNTGLSPWQFVLRWRVDRAAEMLRRGPETDLAVVSSKTGFADQSHLSRAFKRFRGLPPGAYARQVGRRTG